jgi:hypothetical protein
MSAIEQLPDGSALEPPQREPPPIVFAAAAERAAKPVVPRASADRVPLSQAAGRRRTSWIRRVLALIVLLVAIGGVATAIRDSKITVPPRHHAAAHASTLLSAEQLGLAQRHHRAAHHRKHHVTN